MNRRRLLDAAFLAVWAPLLVVGFYYRPALQHGLSALPADNDCVFYVYQLVRAYEVGGRWWQLGDDAKIGAPFDSAAKLHPGIYEGIDAVLLSALLPASVPPELRYHLVVGFFLALNGWVASGLVYARTKSVVFSGLAAALIIFSFPIALRMRVHLHLVKHAYSLLAIWAFFRCLDHPTLLRGAALGLALFLVLQGSFYFGYLLTLALTAYGFGWLLRGHLTWQHSRALTVGAVLLIGLTVPATIPLWRPSTAKMDKAYFQRSPAEAWHNSAELWQYFLPPTGRLQRMPDFNWGGANFPGALILAALLGFGAAWMIGMRSFDARQPAVGQLLILGSFLVLMSLRGGPNLVLALVAKSFRCYDRAGAIAVAIWCVVAPMLLHRAYVWIGARRLGPLAPRLFVALVVCLALGDAVVVSMVIRKMPTASVHPATATPRARAEYVPAWVFWLGEQPDDVKLIALAQQTAGDTGYFADSWNFDSLYYRTLHQHATLNGCSFRQLEKHLQDQGCSYSAITPKGLRSLVDLGYNRLALADNYLAAFPWTKNLTWLELEKGLPGWSIYRIAE